MPISNILELYSRCGRSLIENGLNAAALPLSEANLALSLFDRQGWLVLGGDVYQLMDTGLFESIYENWFYEGDDSMESVSMARNFIESLSDETIFIVFVVVEHR